MVAQVMGPGIRVSNQAFTYLKLQKGNLDHLSHDRRLWESAYRTGLLSTYVQIRPHLPPVAESVLDIGSGLGGIDILINRHYDGRCMPILMDGVDDLPVVKLHRETFSNFRIAELFHADNGVGRVLSVDVSCQPMVDLAVPVPLVISFGSWCFHYPPALYLDYVRRNIAGGGTLIVDVRKEKPAWRTELAEHFELSAVIHEAAKMDRIVCRAR